MVNKAILLGRLGKKPIIAHSKSGMAITNMAIATNKKIKGVDKTEWHRIVLFGKTAEFACERLGVGALVYIEGELQTRKWEKNGHTNYTTEIVCNDLKVQEWGNQAGKEHDRIEETNPDVQLVVGDTSFDSNFDSIQPSFTENEIPF